MSETVRYPVDYSGVEKGSVIPAEVIEEMSGTLRSSAFYSAKQINLCKTIETELALRGKQVLAVCVKDTVRVLTDPEAIEYSRKLFETGLRRAERAHVKMLEIDVRGLSPQEAETRERDIVVQAAVLAGASAGRREVMGVVHERRTPGLPALNGHN